LLCWRMRDSCGGGGGCVFFFFFLWGGGGGREVRISNLSRDADYPDRFFDIFVRSSVSLVVPRFGHNLCHRS